MSFSADIDIDVSAKTDRSAFGIQAIIYDADTQNIHTHPSGYYIDCGMHEDSAVPGMATVDYETAEQLGFTKIDLLSNGSYDYFSSKAEVLEYLNRTPDWVMLEEPEVCECLPQISNHVDLIQKLKPRSIEDLADALALMRPAKKHLLKPYLADKQATRADLYTKVPGIYFKKSHAVAYAHMIVCVMNKLQEIIEQEAL